MKKSSHHKITTFQPIQPGRKTLSFGSDSKLSFGVKDNEIRILHNNSWALSYTQIQALLGSKIVGIDFMPKILIAEDDPRSETQKLAKSLSETHNIPLYSLQHHHAHFLAVMQDNAIIHPNKILHVVFDEGGYGTDGSIWGGEFFVFDERNIRRIGHIEAVSMPGKHLVYLEPYRMMLSHVWATFGGVNIDTLFEGEVNVPNYHEIWEKVKSENTTYKTSSLSLFFDAVSVILTSTFHSQRHPREARKKLQSLALKSDGTAHSLPFEMVYFNNSWEIDLRPTIGKILERLARGISKADIAMGLYLMTANLIAEMFITLKKTHHLQAVSLSGDLFEDSLLNSIVTKTLDNQGIPYYSMKTIPPSDVSIALGQIYGV